MSVIVTFAIDKALLVGFVTYMLGMLVSGRKREISKYMVVSTILLLLGTILSIVRF